MAISEEMKNSAKMFADNMSKYPEEEQLALAAVSENMLNGVTYAYLTDDSDLADMKDLFDKSENCSLYRLTYNFDTDKGGYLIYMLPKYLYGVLRAEAIPAGILTEDDIASAEKARKESILTLDRRMNTEQLTNGNNGTIGIFSTNDYPFVQANKQNFPAYKITLVELAQLCKRNGYGIKLGSAYRDPDTVIEREYEIMSRMWVAPAKTAILVEIGRI